MSNFLKYVFLLLIGVIVGILSYQLVILNLEKLFFPIKEASFVPENREERLATDSMDKNCEKAENKGKAIEVNLSGQKLRMCENAKLIKEITISSGAKETPTPLGSYRVIRKSLMLYSKVTDCWLPFWVGFSGDYGFHEIPLCEKESGRRGLNDLGQPVSAGCIRLSPKEAESFYKWAEIDTPVVIY
jgi:hypothetical protein